MRSTSRWPQINTGDANLGVGGIPHANNLANFEQPGQVFLIAENSTNVRAMLRWRDYELYATDNFKVTPHFTIDAGVRYSIMPPSYQPNGQETSFQPSLYNAGAPTSDACNGLWIVKGTNPCAVANTTFGTSFSSGVVGPNKYLQNVNYHLFAPRVGLNWDILGTGKTVLSAGGGQFFQRERVSRYTLTANAPFSLAASNVSRTLDGPTPAAVSGTVSPTGGYDPRDLLPNSWQWNLTLQQAIGPNSSFSMSYVGNRGEHLTSSWDINQIPEQNWLAASFTNGTAQNAYRPYSNYGTLLWWTHDGNSNYHGLQTLLKTRIHNVQLVGAYTWSHSIADIQLDDSSGSLGQGSRTYFPNPGLDRGNGTTNRPNNFVANAIYTAPFLADKSTLVKGALGGWELSGITTAANGNSFTVFQGATENTSNVVAAPTPILVNGVAVTPTAGSLNALAQLGGTTQDLRPLAVQGQSCSSGRKGSQIINPNAFTLVGYAIGTIPSDMERRGYCQGPNFFNTDFSLDKNWVIREKLTMQFRLDFFDVFNHANFNANNLSPTAPEASVNCGTAGAGGLYQPCSVANNVISAQTSSAGFGQTSALIGNASRQIQYTLHFNF